MTRRYTLPFGAFTMLFSLARPLAAAHLHMEPVMLEMNAPAAAGVLTLRNEEDHEVAVQSRVFRWSQVDGADHLSATRDVVASPPAVRLAPGEDYTVRIVRAAKQPVVGEESYRVLVDELPDAAPGTESGISILVRQSVPVFFRARHVGVPDVSWSTRAENGNWLIVADNHGDTRLRISDLQLHNDDGVGVEFGHGLAGYALGQSRIVFTVKAPSSFGRGSSIAITAATNHGPIVAAATLPSSP